MNDTVPHDTAGGAASADALRDRSGSTVGPSGSHYIIGPLQKTSGPRKKKARCLILGTHHTTLPPKMDPPPIRKHRSHILLSGILLHVEPMTVSHLCLGKTCRTLMIPTQDVGSRPTSPNAFCSCKEKCLLSGDISFFIGTIRRRASFEYAFCVRLWSMRSSSRTPMACSGGRVIFLSCTAAIFAVCNWVGQSWP